MIQVKNLTKYYGPSVAVNNISFTLESGAIYGFLGPNGAGKSTTMNMLTGCLSPTEGIVNIDGLDIYTDALKVKQRLGYLPEIPPLYTELTVSEFLLFVANAKGYKGNDAINEVNRVMEKTNIVDKSERLCSHLSKGYKQRVGIAQAIIGNPDVIILDEPSAGLDPEQIIGMRDLILSILDDDKTIILSSHILSEIAEICDHLLIINHGRIVAQDTMAHLKNEYLAGRNNITHIKVKNSLPGLCEAIEKLENVVLCEWYENEDEIISGKIEYPVSVDIRTELFNTILAYSGSVVEISNETPSLEQVYMDIIEEDNKKIEVVGSDDNNNEQDEDQTDENDEEDSNSENETKNESNYKKLFSNKEDEE